MSRRLLPMAYLFLIYGMETTNTENKDKKAEQTYHCNDCGNVIYRHEVFCSKCGKLLDRYDFE